MLTSIIKYFENKDGWLVIDLNAENDLCEELAAKLYHLAHVKHLFYKEL